VPDRWPIRRARRTSRRAAATIAATVSSDATTMNGKAFRHGIPVSGDILHRRRQDGEWARLQQDATAWL